MALDKTTQTSKPVGSPSAALSSSSREGAPSGAPTALTERILVSPAITFGFFIDRWVNDAAADGSPLRRRTSVPVRLTGVPATGIPAHDSSIHKIVRARETLTINGEDYEGSSLTVDARLARNLGFEDRDGIPALQQLWTYIEKMATYGDRLAFLDDAPALANLMPRFKKVLSSRLEEEENAREFILQSALRGGG